MSDRLLDELSHRCTRLLAVRAPVAHTHRGTPFRELEIGRVYTHYKEGVLDVYLERKDDPGHDKILSCRDGEFSFSSWPHVHEALHLLRVHMVLDDLAAA